MSIGRAFGNDPGFVVSTDWPRVCGYAGLALACVLAILLMMLNLPAMFALFLDIAAPDPGDSPNTPGRRGPGYLFLLPFLVCGFLALIFAFTAVTSRFRIETADGHRLKPVAAARARLEPGWVDEAYRDFESGDPQRFGRWVGAKSRGGATVDVYRDAMGGTAYAVFRLDARGAEPRPVLAIRGESARQLLSRKR